MAEKVQKKGRGCLFYGAITMALVFLGVIAGIYFGMRKAILTAVASYTSSAPAPIPQLQISPQERERIARELARQAQQISQGTGPAQVDLSEKELNVLIAESPEMKAYSQQIYLQPEGDKLKAQLSVPLDQFEHWRALARKIGGDMNNRYVNGTALLNVGITNGALSLSMADLVVNGKSLPEEFTKRMQSQNFAAPANSNAQAQAVLQRVEGIEVRDGKVQVKVRR